MKKLKTGTIYDDTPRQTVGKVKARAIISLSITRTKFLKEYTLKARIGMYIANLLGIVDINYIK